MKKIYALLLCAVMLISFCAGTLAAGNLEEIKAFLNHGITVKYNGEVKEITDATGARTAPITYNGTTYVPIRSVSNLLGVDVGWDAANNTVLLGENPEPAAPATPAEKNLTRGTVNGNVYENSFIGMGFQAPEDWTYLSDEQIGQTMGMAIDYGDLQKMLDEYESFIDAAVVGANGDNIIFAIQKKPDDLKDTSFEEVYKATISALRKQLNESGVYDTVSVTTCDVTIDNKTFPGYVVNSKVQGREMKQKTFLADLGDCIAIINITAWDEVMDPIIERLFIIE